MPAPLTLAQRLLQAARETPALSVPHKPRRQEWAEWRPAIELRLERGESPQAVIAWMMDQYRLLVDPKFVNPKPRTAEWQRFSHVVYRANKAVKQRQALTLRGLVTA
jgi:hypothetical protein